MKKIINIKILLNVPVLVVCALLCVTFFSNRVFAYQDDEGSVIIDVLDLKAVDVSDAFKLIAQKSGLNIVAGKGVLGKITVYLKDIKAKDALKIIVDSYGWSFKQEGKLIKVMTQQEYEDRFGHKFGNEIETRIKKLYFVEADKVIEILDKIKSPEGKILSDAKTGTLILVDEVPILNKMEEILEHVDVFMKTQVFELNYASAKDVYETIKDMVTPNIGIIKYDERTNSIIVSDTSEKLNDLKNAINSFDKKDKEVLIEAKILQVILSDENKMGIDWGAIISGYHNLVMQSTLSTLSDSEKKGKIGIGTLSTDDYEVMLEAINNIGESNILSSPRITAINNKEAKILVGSTEPYVTTTTTTPSSGPTTNAENVNFIEVGVKLHVTPTINNDSYITMKIKPEVSSVTGTIITSTNNIIPIVETSEAESTVMVKDGVTIIIGGLIKEESIYSSKSVPLLSKVPVLGTAFRSKSDLKKKTEIVIFLTPKIITGDVL